MNITRSQLLEKVKDGGIARRSSSEAAQVAKYEAARVRGKAEIVLAIKKSKLSATHKDVQTLTEEWKTIASDLLRGSNYSDIFTAESQIEALAPKMVEALKRVRASCNRKRTFTEAQPETP